MRSVFNKLMPFIGSGLISMLISGTFLLIDGYFIGQTNGDAGLAAINIVYPVVAFLNAVGLTVGVGGGVYYSYLLGRRQVLMARRLLSSILAVLIFLGLVLGVLLSVFIDPLLRFLHCPPEIEALARPYLKIVTTFAVTQVVFMGITPLLRNDGYPRKAMLFIAAGLITNIALDWYFIMYLGMGMFGAAIVTVIGQSLIIILCIAHFLRKPGQERPTFFSIRKVSARIIAKSLVTGLAPGGIGAAMALITLLHNWQALAYGGTTGVTAWTITDYVTTMVLLMIQGVGEGIQPFSSYYYGSKEKHKGRFVFKTGLTFALGISFIFCFLMIVLRSTLAPLFGASKEAGALFEHGIIYMAGALPLMAIVRIVSAYLYATGNAFKASLLVYGDSFVVLPLLLFILPKYLGINGVWLAMPLTFVILTASIFIYLCAVRLKERNKRKHCL
jgi:Na+-driven multidrug efflux pump